MPERTPENVLIDNLCCGCQRRVWYSTGEKYRGKRRYIPPKWFRDMFRVRVGTMPLGYYRVSRCEVCGKTMAIFDENFGALKNEVVVLFQCTLLSQPLEPYDGVKCEDRKSCYACPLKNSPQYVQKG